jgi:hypothetical protein
LKSCCPSDCCPGACCPAADDRVTALKR